MPKQPRALAGDETYDSAQSACDDIRVTLQKALDAIDQAVSCETEADLVANLAEAEDAANEAIFEIRDLLS